MVKAGSNGEKQASRKGKGRAGVELSKESQFLEGLQSADPEMTSTMALHSLHHFIKENRIPDLSDFQQKTTQILKICKVCDNWNQLKQIKTCEICEDNYHPTCYQTPLHYQNGKFVCHNCLYAEIPVKKCKVCTRVIRNTNTIACQYCSSECHTTCLSEQQPVCTWCSKWRENMIVKKTSKKIQKGDKLTQENRNLRESNRNLRDMFAQMKSQGDSIIANSENRFDRKGCYFKAITVLEGRNDEIQAYKAELLEAVAAKQMNYTEDLKDIEFHFEHMKEGNMNFGLENMSTLEEKQYLKYKGQAIGPFHFEQLKDKGYGIVAGRPIPKRSIICEYTGEVVTLRECAQLEMVSINDSKMDLWVGRHSDEKLIIRPEKWTNIARFINGVKNSRSGKNVDSIRVCYRGLPVVLLVARRDIEKGESLCYDYNAGGIQAKYDTSGFVE